MSEQIDHPTDHPFYDKSFKKNFYRYQNEQPPPELTTEAIDDGAERH